MFNILRSIIIGFLTFTFSLSPFFTCADSGCEPKFNGTFLQTWLCREWSDERWNTEFEHMREAEIDYLILQCTAKRENENSTTCDYDSRLEELEGCWHGASVIETALYFAEKYDMKVFIGLADYNNWWTDCGNSDEYTEICRLSADMAAEIYAMYHDRFDEALYGWYFVPEISNSEPFRYNIKKIACGVKLLCDSLTENTPDMPLMLSPFISDYTVGASVSAMLRMWAVFFNNAGLRDGDIFAPQDSAGGSVINYLSLEKRWKMYYAAVKSSGCDIRLWANCECFSSGRNALGFPDSREEFSGFSQTLDRFTTQLGDASRYVENIITFSYNHYMSPALVNSVFHDTYIDYLHNGFTLESIPPEAPQNILTERRDDGTLVSWDAAYDNIGIAYYQVYRNGIFLANLEAEKSGIPTQYLDTSPICRSSRYTVIAVDGAGNISNCA